ncbi:MAG: MBL fold metallo-hydrolase [Candidatus Adiutrix sp.]
MKFKFRKKTIGKVMIILLIICTLTALGICLFLNQAKFGGNPTGSHLAEIAKSANYRDGEFRNIVELPTVIHNEGRLKSFSKFFFSKRERPKPTAPVPSIKTDLKTSNGDMAVWLGHSSYFFRLSGLTVLVDPVFSTSAAPVFFANKAFAGTSIYGADDMPEIDFLLITHDHWDHLDYPSVMALKGKIKNIIVPLGVGAHFSRWNFAPEIIKERDWHESIQADGLDFHLLPAHHYSGRWLEKNKTLWASFALISPNQKIFISGDSGYGPHYKAIGQQFGGFNLAILDSGQYDLKWPYIHMTPEEAATATIDLEAKALIPGHIGKFSIAYHSWDEPFIRSLKSAKANNYRLLTPIIGQKIDLNDNSQQFNNWWEDLP